MKKAILFVGFEIVLSVFLVLSIIHVVSAEEISQDRVIKFLQGISKVSAPARATNLVQKKLLIKRTVEVLVQNFTAQEKALTLGSLSNCVFVTQEDIQKALQELGKVFQTSQDFQKAKEINPGLMVLAEMLEQK